MKKIIRSPVFLIFLLFLIPVIMWKVTFKIEWVGLSVAWLVGIGAIMQAQIIRWFFPPELCFKETKPVPQIEFIEKREVSDIISNGILKYTEIKYTMYRIAVVNNGHAPARDIRALVTGIDLPLNLYWTHINKITRDISCGETAYLDVIQENNGKFKFYPLGHMINLPEYEFSSIGPKEIKIEFFEKDGDLQSVKLKFDPVAKALKALQ